MGNGVIIPVKDDRVGYISDNVQVSSNTWENVILAIKDLMNGKEFCNFNILWVGMYYISGYIAVKADVYTGIVVSYSTNNVLAFTILNGVVTYSAK